MNFFCGLSLLYNQYNRPWIRQNLGLVCSSQPKLPYIHFSIYHNANEKSLYVNSLFRFASRLRPRGLRTKIRVRFPTNYVPTRHVLEFFAVFIYLFIYLSIYLLHLLHLFTHS